MLSTGLTSTINANWLGSEGINTYAYGRDYAASEYAIDSATIRDRDSINDMTQYRVFGEWTNSNGRFRDSLTSIEFGFSNIKQDFRDKFLKLREKKYFDLDKKNESFFSNQITKICKNHNIKKSKTYDIFFHNKNTITHYVRTYVL